MRNKTRNCNQPAELSHPPRRLQTLKSCTFLTASVLAIARQGMVDCVHTDPALSSQAHSVKPPPVPQQAMEDIKQSGTEPDSYSTTVWHVSPKPYSETLPAKAFQTNLGDVEVFCQLIACELCVGSWLVDSI